MAELNFMDYSKEEMYAGWQSAVKGLQILAVLWIQAVEKKFGKEASFAKIKPRIELICRDNLRKLLDESTKMGRMPTELLYDKVEDTLYSGAQFSEPLKGVEKM